MDSAHRCARGYRCIDAETIGETRQGREIAAEAGLCPSCERIAERAIRHLPTDYVQLHQLLAKTKTAGGVPVSGTRELPVPIDLAVEALLAEIHHETLCWAESVAEILGADVDTQALRTYRPAVLVQHAADHLVDHLAVLLALRDVVHIVWTDGQRDAVDRHGYQGAVALLALHERALAHLGLTRLTHHLPAPCPSCERCALRRHDGDDTVECAACAHRLTWDDYQALCNLLTSTTGGVV